MKITSQILENATQAIVDAVEMAVRSIALDDIKNGLLDAALEPMVEDAFIGAETVIDESGQIGVALKNGRIIKTADLVKVVTASKFSKAAALRLANTLETIAGHLRAASA